MHKLAAYLKEREGVDSIIAPEGFASYLINGDECYIKDIWVEPDFRNTKFASTIANDIADIARASGCKYLTGTVSTTAHNPTASAKVLLAYGFNIFEAIQHGIIFRKDL